MAKVRNLEQLHKEKNKAQLRIEVSKIEFTESLENVKLETRDVIKNKLIIPAGIASAVSVASFGISKMVSSSRQKKQAKAYAQKYAQPSYVPVEKTEKVKKFSFAQWQNLAMKLLPIGIQLVQSYFIQEEINNENT